MRDIMSILLKRTSKNRLLDMLYHLARKALFQLDPEKAHELTFRQLQRLNHSPSNVLFANLLPLNPFNAWGFPLKTH